MVLITNKTLQAFEVVPPINRSSYIFWHTVSYYSWVEFLLLKISVLLIMCLSLERWFAVVKPILYRHRFTKTRVYLYMILIIFISTGCKIYELLPDYTIHATTTKILAITEVVLTTFVPLAVTWITYAHLWHQIKTAQPNNRKHLPRSSVKAKQKLLCMCAVTAIFITVCWLPGEIQYLLDFVTELPGDPSNYTVFYLLALSNPILNPWLYYLTNKEYNRECKSLCRDFCVCFFCKKKCCDQIEGSRYGMRAKNKTECSFES